MRKLPVQPLGPNGPTFHDLRPGDRVTVPRSGRTGVIVKRCAPKSDGWIVAWDEPMFGCERSRVAWPNLEPVRDLTADNS